MAYTCEKNPNALCWGCGLCFDWQDEEEEENVVFDGPDVPWPDDREPPRYWDGDRI